MTYTTQTFERPGGFSVIRFIAGVLVVTVVAATAAGAVLCRHCRAGRALSPFTAR